MGARSTIERWLERIEASLSVGVTIGTAFVAVLGLAAFLVAIVRRGLLAGTFDATAIAHLLDVGLVVFIALELFKIGIAHLRNRSILSVGATWFLVHRLHAIDGSASNHE
jgi:hypothetical protein